MSSVFAICPHPYSRTSWCASRPDFNWNCTSTPTRPPPEDCAWEITCFSAAPEGGGPRSTANLAGRRPFSRAYSEPRSRPYVQLRMHSRREMSHIVDYQQPWEMTMAYRNRKEAVPEFAAPKNPASAPKNPASAPIESIVWFDDPECTEVSRVGGKNAGLAEVTRTLAGAGIRVPPGFAVTAAAYRAFLEAGGLVPKLRQQIDAFHRHKQSPADTGGAMRRIIVSAEFPAPIAESILAAYGELAKRCATPDPAVAVRSSATAEDLPQASFAGQQETYLNVSGAAELLRACRKCYASLFTNRAIVYRETNGFDHLQVALSIGIQKMVRSDRAGSGVMFTLDTETGFRGVVVVNAAWGLGENVVQGTVNPDKYVVFKPLLADAGRTPIIEKTLGKKERKLINGEEGGAGTRKLNTTRREREAMVLGDAEILQLARWAASIEKHYERPMDIEWAKDGDSGEIFVVQARPETVQSAKSATLLKTYSLTKKGRTVVSGAAIGEAISTGKACIIHSAADIGQFRDGSILVTESTDPDWVPIMKKAAGLITNYGGTPSHAAIVSRELGLPAIVGTLHATELIHDKQPITLSCAEGEEGTVYDGILDFLTTEVDLADVPATKTAMMVNIASPAAAFRWWRLPAKGKIGR